MKKILHYGNLTGLPFRYARACEMVGINAENVLPNKIDFMELKRELPFDDYLGEESDSKFSLRKKRINFFLKAISKYSLIHYYSTSILPRNLDYILFKLLNKPMLISFGGTDVRLNSRLKDNPYFYQMPYSIGEEKIKLRLKKISNNIAYAATTHELMGYIKPYFKKVFYLPQVIDIEQYKNNPPNILNKKPVILHIPTHREFKGTEFLEAAVKRLQRDGLEFEFRLLESNLTQEEVRDKVSKADIVVDQIRCGTHGVFAVEAMASGKPTLCYIRDEILRKKSKDFPIINANPENIYDKLKELIIDSNMRNEIGKKSRKYAERVHSLVAVGKALSNIYTEIGLKIN